MLQRRARLPEQQPAQERAKVRLALRLPAIGADLLQDPAAATLERLGAIMGRDFADVSPLDGVFIGGSGQRMKVSVEVTPLGP